MTRERVRNLRHPPSDIRLIASGSSDMLTRSGRVRGIFYCAGNPQ